MNLPPLDVYNNQIKRFKRLGKIIKRKYPQYKDE